MRGYRHLRDVPLYPRLEPPDRAARRAGADRVLAGRARPRAARPARAAEGQGSRDPVDVQPDRGLCPRGGAAARGALARGLSPGARGLAGAVHLHVAAREGGHARVPRGERARFDGPGRAADPGPDEAGGAARGIRRQPRPRVESPVSAHVRRGEGRAIANGDRQRLDLDGRRGGEACRAHLSDAVHPAAPVHRGG